MKNKKLATPIQRFVAALIDWLIIIALFWIPVLGWVLEVTYILLKDSLPFLDGQSVGKKVMNLRAVKDNNKPLTNNYEASLIRNVSLLIPFFNIIDALMVILDKNHKRFGDKWAKTKVIQL